MGDCLMEGMVDAKARRWEHAGGVPDIREGQCGWDRVRGDQGGQGGCKEPGGSGWEGGL